MGGSKCWGRNDSNKEEVTMKAVNVGTPGGNRDAITRVVQWRARYDR